MAKAPRFTQVSVKSATTAWVAGLTAALAFASAPPLSVPIVPQSPNGDAADCSGWSVLKGRATFPLGDEDCPMRMGASGVGTCTVPQARLPRLIACATAIALPEIDTVRADASVQQHKYEPYGDHYGHPCSCMGTTPNVMLVGERSSTIFAAAAATSQSRTFTVKVRGEARLNSDLDINASWCTPMSCAGITGFAEWRFILPLSNAEAEREMQLNGYRSVTASGVGFCTGATTVAGGVEVGLGGVGVNWSYQVGGTLARARQFQASSFEARFCIASESAVNGLEFKARGTVYGGAWLTVGQLSSVRAEVDLHPVKINFSELPAEQVTACLSCAADELVGPHPEQGNGAME